jgi:integrase
MKHLQPSQIEALVKAANETVMPTAADRERLIDRNRLLFTMCYEHGLRISECLSLTRAHVRRGYLSIKGKKKGKRTDEKINPSNTQQMRLGWAAVSSAIRPTRAGLLEHGFRKA